MIDTATADLASSHQGLTGAGEGARREPGAGLVLVSNRLPTTMCVRRGEAAFSPSSGGLATALRGPHARSETLWVGWTGEIQNLRGKTRASVRDELARRRLVAVPLTRADVQRYYDGFSNGVLWPLMHYLLDKVRLDADRDWAVYREVNARFAECVAATADRGAAVWVHDYHLMLVPGLLRALRPDLRVGFFLHVPFPSHEVFRVLPWRAELLRGVLGADVVGFHTQAYQHHFVTTVAHVLGTDVDDEAVEWEGRRVQVSAFPIGIDVDRFAREARSDACASRVMELRREAGRRAIVLGVDRLDYTKGIPRRLLAIERLLERSPAMRDRLHYIQVAVPTRDGVDAYLDYRRAVNEHVGRINGAYGQPSAVPIHLLHRGVPFEELVALYRAADVMVVTPIRDGMNLVAKEYCASRLDGAGVLVLSELAGAAQELTDALIVNPYDIGEVASAIQRAIEMPPEESSQRMSALRAVVEANHVDRWAASFLDALAAPRADASAQLDPRGLAGALSRARAAAKRLWLFDYDGTLAPFAATPDRAAPDDGLIELLGLLATMPGTRVEIVSGRARENLAAWLGALPVGLHAEHGLWSRARPGEPWRSDLALDTAWKGPVRDVIEGAVSRLSGSLVEEKSASVVWHYRRVLPELASTHLAEVRALLAPLAARYDLRVTPGAKSLEVRSARVSKGAVSARLAAEMPGAVVIAAGDDTTDEDMFRALPADAVTVKVGQGVSAARYRVDGVRALRELIQSFVRLGDLGGDP
ncbi:MAG: bifunctional alpha,alpha-trehalose-phosphate synthase (UDP-forming)/trehalose-phosphatase [Polyangiales bacterium]